MTQHSNDNPSFDDLQSYPILTEEIGAISAPSGTNGATASSLGALVENALREVLGWRPRRTDAAGFKAALTQSFSEAEVDGRTTWHWTPHSYSIQADLGAVTGAQASIYAYAKAALDQSLPLLENLSPLLSAADLEDVDAIRAVVHSNLTELVHELGMVGGPRVQRVDELVTALLGEGVKHDPEHVGGQLRQLREALGLENQFVNTIEEERTLTDFLILANHVIALNRSWEAQRKYFDRDGGDVYFGTQLVLLSRTLAVVGESVQQARYVMDSVFIGEAERQTIDLQLNADEPTITVAELLAWVEHVATVEGPRLVRDGGKEGAIALTPTLLKLFQLVDAARRLSEDPSTGLPRGFHTPRVQRTLEELAKHLDDAHREAAQIKREQSPAPAPATIVCVKFDPTQLHVGERLTVTVVVRNDSDRPLTTQGPLSGYTYAEDETFETEYPESKGAIRIGVDYEGRTTGKEYPYRWGVDAELKPGDECIVIGYIDLKTVGTRKYWVGLVEEKEKWHDENVEPTAITIEPAQNPDPVAGKKKKQ